MAETTPSIILNPNGKQQLMASGVKISAHREIVSHRQFQDSVNMALLHYQNILARNSDPTNAGANMMKLRGAHEFVSEFIALTEPPKIAPAIVKTAELDHRA